MTLEMGDESGWVDLSQDDAAVFGDCVDTVFFGVGGTDEDRGGGNSLGVDECAGCELVDVDETAFGETEELSVLRADVHVDGEVAGELLVERVFRCAFVLWETLRRVGELAENDSRVSLTRLALEVREDVGEVSVIMHFSLTEAAAVTFQRLLVVVVDLVQLDVTVDVLLVGGGDTKESSPVALTGETVSDDLDVLVCKLAGSLEYLNEVLLSLQITVVDLRRGHHCEDVVVHPSHEEDCLVQLDVL